jgi:hypothetical protein
MKLIKKNVENVRENGLKIKFNRNLIHTSFLFRFFPEGM